MIRWIRRQLEPYQADPRLRAVSRAAFLTNMAALAVDLFILIPLVMLIDDLETAHTVQSAMWYTFVSMFALDSCVILWLELEKHRLSAQKAKRDDYN